MDLKNFILKNNYIITAKIITKSSCDKIFIENDIIKIKIREVPENGKANIAIVDLIHNILKIPKQNIQILSGKTNSIKKILINFN